MEGRRGEEYRALEGTGEDTWDPEDAQSIGDELRSEQHKRNIMLACACLLGLGSHFGAYVLGPIKSSLKTSESAFASLIGSFELLNTVTPLLSGFLVPRFGAAKVGLAATGIVLAGQTLVCLSQGHNMNMAGTICGFVLFGGGISPVSVVQETIILSNNTSTSRSVGRSVALGLVLGKTSSFLASASSDWLHSISPRMPFAAGTAFSAISFTAALVYARTERSLTSTLPAKTHRHSPVNLASYMYFGDLFWIYIAICFLAGSWYCTIHLSTHILQAVYQISQRHAGEAASILLLSPTFLYPLAGWALDKRPELMASLYIAAPLGLACTLFALIFLSSIVPYTFVLVGAAVSCGIGPILSVLVVPRLVNSERASAALALHKSLEMSGGIVFQTVSGVLLSQASNPIDTRDPAGSGGSASRQDPDPDPTLFFLLLASLVQLGFVSGFSGLMRRRHDLHVDSNDNSVSTRTASLRMRVSTEQLRSTEGRQAGRYGLLLPDDDEADFEVAPSDIPAGDSHESQEEDEEVGESSGEELGKAELQRGKRCLVIAGATIVFSWCAFFLNLLLI